MSGLENGEEIVTNGVFTVDASAQLEGKRSMMNNDNAPAATSHANHGTTASANLEHAMLKVKGNCDLCKERIETAAKKVKGVSTASWDVKEKVLHLNFDKKLTSKAAISKAVAKVGHDTELDKATDADYKALHSCCQFER